MNDLDGLIQQTEQQLKYADDDLAAYREDVREAERALEGARKRVSYEDHHLRVQNERRLRNAKAVLREQQCLVGELESRLDALNADRMMAS